MRRYDGSIRSKNNPITANRHMKVDHGLYTGIVVERHVPLLNINSTTNGEMTYTVRLIGGMRDGQIIPGCRVMRTMGGRNSFSDITLKPQTSPTFTEIGSMFNVTTFSGNENGDYVYIQFLSGNPSQPIIVGFQKSPLDGNDEIPRELALGISVPTGQHKIESFNGVKSSIGPNGVFEWTSGLGGYNPTIFVDVNNPTAPFVNEYVPIVGSEDFFKLSVDTTFQEASFKAITGIGVSLGVFTDSIDMTTATQTGLSLNGATASASLSNILGTGVTVDGPTDSVTLGTAVGASIAVSGVTDSIDLATTAGASFSISGLTDTINIDTLSGSGVEVSPTGVTIQNAIGSKLELPVAGLSLTDATGAGLEISPAGFIKLGNAAADLVDIIDQLITSLSTASYAGFGSPGSNVADLVQLATQIKLIKGG